MRKLLLILLLPILAGCSCTTCLQDDVRKLYNQEQSNFVAINAVIPEFFKEEFKGIGGIKKDLTRQFDYESIDPRTYFKELHELFCSCH